MLDISQKPYFHYNDAVNLIMQPISSRKEVRFHSLIRIFPNGERFFVSHNKEESIDYLENRLYRYGLYEKSHKTHHQNISSCFRMWDFLPYSPPEIFQRRSQKFKMAHGLTIIQQHKDYCDFFGFSTDPGNSQINNFYLDQKELFSKFVQDFYETLSPDLENLKQYSFRIPSEVSKPKKQALGLSNRQKECGVLISQGYSAKEIARILNLSHRTVEFYLDNLRQRVGAKNRAHLCSIIRYFV